MPPGLKFALEVIEGDWLACSKVTFGTVIRLIFTSITLSFSRAELCKLSQIKILFDDNLLQLKFELIIIALAQPGHIYVYNILFF